MIFRHLQHSIFAMTATLALTACGGGSNTHDVVVTELPDSDRATLSGDWPFDRRTPTEAFLITNDQEWQLAWSKRKASLDCASYLEYNQPACAASSPPAIDFSKYSLVGLLLRPALYFAEPNPTRVFVEEEARLLVVEYQYRNPYHTPSLLETSTRFFLVPKTDLDLSARPKDTTPH